MTTVISNKDIPYNPLIAQILTDLEQYSDCIEKMVICADVGGGATWIATINCGTNDVANFGAALIKQATKDEIFSELYDEDYDEDNDDDEEESYEDIDDG